MQNKLSNKIINQIKISGPISIAEFMQLCLLDPQYGYYTNENPFGSEGDFITSPEISQCFGEVIALYCLYYLQDSEGEIQIIELGPGRALLMQDMLRTFQKFPNFNSKISVHLVEKSPKLRKIQQEKLAGFGFKIHHYSEFNQVPKSLSFIISNELLDCIPMQQFEFSKAEWYERKIDYQDNFCFRLAKTPASLLYPKLFLADSSNNDGDVFELSSATITLINEIAEFTQITKSKALIFDYGYNSYDFKPTIQAVKSHKYKNIFANLGQQDLTYLVNFSAIQQTLAETNLCNYALYDQGDFLLSIGLGARIDMCKQNKSEEIKAKLDRSLYRLTSKEEMGSLFKVLELS
ncbi:MAG: hypothetical protein HOM96_01610 [Rickettsiales bacterium]|jgi:NADH dehydrogenase [ubiquinone] 1 alpha subcomplex assembly factor 7|nr:hypothetical protein [Rickettsiales bacterium]